MRRVTRYAAITAFAFIVLTCTPVAYLYSLPLRVPSSPRPSDVIVLLSSGQIDEQWLSLDGGQRTLGALRLYRDGYGPVIISSGSTPGRGERQAELQAEWLMRAGVPKTSIVIESRSHRTWESGVEVTRIMKEHGFRSAVVVTSEMDVPRVQRVFAKLGVPVSVLAAPEYRPPGLSLIYFPAGPAVFYHSTYEYAGLALYKWKGWI